MDGPTLEDLLVSYRKALMAKVQLLEFLGWGPGVDGSMRKTIAMHEETEAAYVAAEVQRRRQAS